MRISARQAHVDADRSAQRRITELFREIVDQLAAALTRAANGDGTIAPSMLPDLQQHVATIVEPQFVQRVPAAAVPDEAEHLQDLIDQAQRDMRGASEAERQRLAGRVQALGERQALLVAGTALIAFRDGAPVTPYARIIAEQGEQVIRLTGAKHARMMQIALNSNPEILAWLQQGRTLPATLLQRHQPLATWADTRGYRLSDRIWNVNRVTQRRIDALLADGIARGRAAVDMAKDLERFLLPTRRRIKTRTPYGTLGSFDARRLARSEITRAASTANYMAGMTNPFVERADYNLSGSHDPDNCDGTCDSHAAESEANDGFAPSEVPLPMLDSHPQCMCYVTYRTANREQVIAQLREQMGADMQTLAGAAVETAPPATPLVWDLFIPALIYGAVEAFTRS